MPTGAGKSLIALLICEAWRREGATVAVLTGNKALARQMESEGQRLGVPVVRFEGEGGSIPLSARRRYRRAEAIAVMNYWVMFNQNPVIDSADLLVIDDAHLAEGALDSLYSAEIDRHDHPALFWSLTAIATVVLAVGAIVTGVFAFLCLSQVVTRSKRHRAAGQGPGRTHEAPSPPGRDPVRTLT